MKNYEKKTKPSTKISAKYYKNCKEGTVAKELASQNP
jgi:hypothetical protein